MTIATLTGDAWTELADTSRLTSGLRVRTIEASPAVWLVDAPTAPTGDEPAADADAELLDGDKRETRIGVAAPAAKLWGRVRGRGLVNRVIVSTRING